MGYKSLNKLLEKSFRDNRSREALSNYKGETLTYFDVAKKICLFHLCFSQCGLQKGDKVAICSRNQANWGVCFLAALTYGAVPVPILHEFKPDNIHYLVNHSEARVFFVGDVVWEGLSESEMPGVSVIVQMDNLHILYSRERPERELIKQMYAEFEKIYPNGFNLDHLDFYRESPDDLALINYTSGTSGYSKGVMIPYRSLWCNLNLAGVTAEPQMSCDSEMVAMLPSAHMYGLMFDFLFEMTIGAHVHYLTRVPSPKVIMAAFADVHPDAIVAVPLIMEKVYKLQLKPVIEKNKFYLNLPILSQAVQKRIRNELIEAFGGRFEEVILGGAPCNPEVEDFLHRIHFPFTIGYGMTECGPIITYSKWYKCKKGSCGQAVPGCRIRIDSPDPANVPGEIQVTGDNVFLGYYKNEQATKSAFTSDGWFKTGDMGVLDDDGYLYIKGRSKCMILGSSGQNIYPEELEAVINNVSYVVDSLVVEEKNALTALIFPDYHQGILDGLDGRSLEEKISGYLPKINEMLPAYAHISKIEFMPEDFERTPKRSIKRYLYQRNQDDKV
ncbi:MAG: AMP-binding protein [Bacteroidales bacterium]|nr:AMP-binding protein [Bacteroidales bacterium]